MKLSRQILFRIFIIGAISIALVMALTYGSSYYVTKNKTIDRIAGYVDRRIEQENRYFESAVDHLELFSEEFLNFYRSDVQFSDADFWELYEPGPDGEHRMKEEFHDEHFVEGLGVVYGLSSFIGNNQSVSDTDFRRRLIIAYYLVSRFGPAWYNEKINLHTSFPENAITAFDPVFAWGRFADPGLTMNEYSVIAATLQKNNPDRTPVWTGLYFDETVSQWALTYECPVDYQGRHLVNPSLDMKLDDIMERLEADHLKGSYNFLIRDDGYLVAHPGEGTEDQKLIGMISLEENTNEDIVRMFSLLTETPETEIRRNGTGLRVVEDKKGGNFLFAEKLNGPNWYFVVVYPKSEITSSSHRASWLVLFLGSILFVVYTAVTFFVINHKAINPIRQLSLAIASIGEGHYKAVADGTIVLPVDLGNEVGDLAGGIRNMAERIDGYSEELEQVVRERTLELEKVNAKLVSLSLLDGLTGIHNRRSFDADLKQVFAEASEGKGRFMLLLADVDLFKYYNDDYGHVAGDEALAKIASFISSGIRSDDRVYRYGGEEFAVIFNTGGLPGNETNTAGDTFQRIMISIQNLNIEHKRSPCGVLTVSAGLCEYSSSFESPEQMIQCADKRLYMAKKKGRNILIDSPPV